MCLPSTRCILCKILIDNKAQSRIIKVKDAIFHRNVIMTNVSLEVVPESWRYLGCWTNYSIYRDSLWFRELLSMIQYFDVWQNKQWLCRFGLTLLYLYSKSSKQWDQWMNLAWDASLILINEVIACQQYTLVNLRTLSIFHYLHPALATS